jgi:hypothetical protein
MFALKSVTRTQNRCAPKHPQGFAAAAGKARRRLRIHVARTRMWL